MNGPDSKFTETMGVRIQCDEAEYIRLKAEVERPKHLRNHPHLRYMGYRG